MLVFFQKVIMQVQSLIDFVIQAYAQQGSIYLIKNNVKTSIL